MIGMQGQRFLCVIEMSGHREHGVRCEITAVEALRSVDYGSDLDGLIKALPLTESTASLLQEQATRIPHGRGIDIGLDEDAFTDSTRAREALQRVANSPDAESYSIQWINSALEDLIPLWLLNRCHRMRLHLWTRSTHVWAAHCTRCLMERSHFAAQAEFGIYVPWIDSELNRHEELPRPFAPDATDSPLRLLLDAQSLKGQEGNEARAIDYLGLLDDSKSILTARMSEAPSFPTGARVELRWNPELGDESPVSLASNHSALPNTSLGWWSGVQHLTKNLGTQDRAMLAVAGKAFHAVVTTDRRLLEEASSSNLMHTTLLPSEALRLAALKMSLDSSIPMKQEANARWSLMRDHFLLARVHSRVPLLRKFGAFLLASKSSERADSEALAAARSIESRLVHLSLAENKIGYAFYANTPGVETELAYQLDHFVLLAQALFENIKWLLAAMSGADHGLKWPDFMKDLRGRDPNIHSFLISQKAQALRKIIGTLRVPSAHKDHWPDDLSSFGHVAAASRHRLAMTITGGPATTLVEEIVILGGNPDDWGIEESASSDPKQLAVTLEPYPFAVHLETHIAWLVNETINQIGEVENVSQELIDDYLSGMAKMNPALNPEWYPEIRLLDWPIPSPS